MGSVTCFSILIAGFGICSFVAGIMAEIKKRPYGSAHQEHGFMICQYALSDPTILWGFVSIGFLAVSAFFGFVSLFFRHKGKRVPCSLLFANNCFHFFFTIALVTTGAAAGLLVWPTVTEIFHRNYNKHYNVHNECATAKTGLLGGGAFLSLDASLLWLVALMIVCNVREDYLEDKEKINDEGEYEAIADDTQATADHGMA